MKKMKERDVILEQRQLAFQSFVRNVEKLSKVLLSGKTLAELAISCEEVCNHTCTDGYESTICNVNRWIHLLQKAEKEHLIPKDDVKGFLDFIICDKQNHPIRSSCKKAFLSITTYQYFCTAKSRILDAFSNGITIFELISLLEDDSHDPDTPFIYGWLCILKKADEQDIIPGDSIRDFLSFI